MLINLLKFYKQRQYSIKSAANTVYINIFYLIIQTITPLSVGLFSVLFYTLGYSKWCSYALKGLFVMDLTSNMPVASDESIKMDGIILYGW